MVIPVEWLTKLQAISSKLRVANSLEIVSTDSIGSNTDMYPGIQEIEAIKCIAMKLNVSGSSIVGNREVYLPYFLDLDDHELQMLLKGELDVFFFQYLIEQNNISLQHMYCYLGKLCSVKKLFQ